MKVYKMDIVYRTKATSDEPEEVDLIKTYFEQNFGLDYITKEKADEILNDQIQTFKKEIKNARSWSAHYLVENEKELNLKETNEWKYSFDFIHAPRVKENLIWIDI